MGYPQNFVSQSGPAISATWLNALDVLANSPAALDGAQTVEQILVALGLTPADLVTILAAEGIVPATAQGIGALFYPQTAAEDTAGVIPTNFQYPPGYPERYIAAGFTNTAGNGGTDFAPAINTALGIIGQPCYLGANYYAIKSQLQFPPAAALLGAGMWMSNLCCVASGWTSSHVMVDTGNAAKIVIKNLGVYGNNITADGINLGNNSVAFGTGGTIDQVYIANVSKAALNLTTNVADLGTLYFNTAGGVQVLGSGTHIDNLSVVGATGVLDVNSNLTACYLGDIHVADLEIEAPASGIIFLTVNGATRIDALWSGLLASATYTELIYVTSNAENWRVNIPAIYYGGSSGTYGQYSHVFYDQSAGVFFGNGSNPSSAAASQTGIGDYGYSQYVQGPTLAVKKQPIQGFSLQINNSSGTLQHRISAVGNNGTASNFVSAIGGASAAYTNTPTGTDSTTAFAGGGKISSAAPSLFLINSGNSGISGGEESDGDCLVLAAIGSVNISGGTIPYTVQASYTSVDVNGTTQLWLALQLLNGFTGAAASWATVLGSSGNNIVVNVLGFVA